MRLVEVDWVGCPATRPARQPASGADSSNGPASTTLVPPQPTSISICIFHRVEMGDVSVEGRLRGSRLLIGDLAGYLAARLNDAKPGGNPDPPASVCTQSGPIVPDMRIMAHTGTTSTTVWVTFGSCHGRGMDNGVRQAQLTQDLIFPAHGRTQFLHGRARIVTRRYRDAPVS